MKERFWNPWMITGAIFIGLGVLSGIVMAVLLYITGTIPENKMTTPIFSYILPALVLLGVCCVLLGSDKVIKDNTVDGKANQTEKDR